MEQLDGRNGRRDKRKPWGARPGEWRITARALFVEGDGGYGKDGVTRGAGDGVHRKPPGDQ